MSSVVSSPNHTFIGQVKSSKLLTSIVHILSPGTDSCPSWISGRERMTVENNIINLHERMLPTRRGLNPRPHSFQSDANPTEPSRPTLPLIYNIIAVSGTFPLSAVFGQHHAKTYFGHMRTAKAQISLRIRAVWSWPSLSLTRINGYYKMTEWRAKNPDDTVYMRRMN